MSNKDFLSQFQGQVSTVQSDGRVKGASRGSGGASASRAARSGSRGSARGTAAHQQDHRQQEPPASNLRIQTNQRTQQAYHGDSPLASAGGSPKVRRAAAASAMRGGPAHRPTVHDLDRYDDPDADAAYQKFVSHSQSGSPPRQQRHKTDNGSHQAQQRRQEYHHSPANQNQHPPPAQQRSSRSYADNDGYDDGFESPQHDLPQAASPHYDTQHNYQQQQQQQQQQPSHEYHNARPNNGRGNGAMYSSSGYSYAEEDPYYHDADNESYATRSFPNSPSTRSRERGGYAQRSTQGGGTSTSSSKSRRKTKGASEGAFRELSHLKQKDYKDDGMRKKRNEKLVKSSRDQLYYSKKARAVTSFKPKTLSEYRATKANGYQTIPSLQPDLEDPELVRKRAIKARQKEFSQRLQKVNRRVIKANGPVKKKPAPKVVTKHEKMKEYASRVPKPKVQPIRPSEQGQQQQSPRRTGRSREAAADEDEMQAASDLEQLLLMRENYTAEIEAMKQEYLE